MSTDSEKLVSRFIHKYGRLPTEVDPDYLEMLRMSKYRILAVPFLKPAKCANCGSTKEDGRRYIDFGLDIDWYGIVYLCGLCLHDIASAMGLFKNFETKILELELKLQNTLDMQVTGEGLKDEFLHIFKEVKTYLDGILPPGSDSISDSGTVVDSDAPTNESTKPDEPVTTPTKSRTTKSTTSSGSENFPSLTALLDAGQ